MPFHYVIQSENHIVDLPVIHSFRRHWMQVKLW